MEKNSPKIFSPQYIKLFSLFLDLYAAFMGFPGGASGKEPDCQSRRRKRCRFNLLFEKIPPGGEHGNPLQYSYLENPMDRGAWQAIVLEVSRSWT